jgi:ribonuclease Z
MGQKSLFLIIPLILSIGLAPAIPFSDAAEYDQICIDKVWLENSKGKIACVTPGTANALVERGWGTVLEELEDAPVEMIPYMPGDEIDYEAEKSIVPFADGGTEPLIITPVIGTPTKQYEPHPMHPGQEPLAEDEMRIIFCGTGMPFPTWNQAATCIVVELGNGEKFIFDIGAGSISRLNGLGLDSVDLDKIFVSHLHVDHMGDLGVFLAQGFMRTSEPFDVYGPSGPNHELGATVAFENILKTYEWDVEVRRGTVPVSGMSYNIHEFDYSKTQIIYDENDVTVTSFPAVHGIDGAVGFRLDWNGLSMVFSGDTKPSKFFVENAQDADIVIHESFATAETLVDKLSFSEDNAVNISEFLHTPPKGTAVVFDMTNPRLAVMYHQIIDSDVVRSTFDEARQVYDGPTLFAQDLTIMNITPDYIVVRQGIPDPVSFPVQDPSAAEAEVDPTNYPLSDQLVDSEIDWKSYIEEKNGN